MTKRKAKARIPTLADLESDILDRMSIITAPLAIDGPNHNAAVRNAREVYVLLTTYIRRRTVMRGLDDSGSSALRWSATTLRADARIRRGTGEARVADCLEHAARKMERKARRLDEQRST